MDRKRLHQVNVQANTTAPAGMPWIGGGLETGVKETPDPVILALRGKLNDDSAQNVKVRIVFGAAVCGFTDMPPVVMTSGTT